MPSVLEELYYGNIHPNCKFYAQDSSYMEAVKLKNANFEKLFVSLNKQEKELFDKYCDAQDRIEGITRLDTFRYAVKLGILLASEVFVGADEVTGYGNEEL